MRELSSGLLAAQQAASRVPYLKAVASNKLAGVVRLTWERLYTGNEPDYYHAVTIPGDGSLIRVRVSPGDDNNKLYLQRTVNPGPNSNFSTWLYTGQFGCQAVTVTSRNNEVAIFWINLNQELKCMLSADYGANFGNPFILDYSPYSIAEGISAAYRPDGDLAVFFTAENSLYVKQRVSGVWQDKSAWDKNTGYLTSVAVFYDDDWNILVTGRDTDANFMLWSVLFSGVWSELREVESAPADGDYEFRSVYIDKAESATAFYVEKFSGIEAYSRPFCLAALPETEFTENLWREPVPFNLSSEYGVAIAHDETFYWLSCPSGVWRASFEGQVIELTDDVVSARIELLPDSGKLKLELQNNKGKYLYPGIGDLLTLSTGSQVDISPGYLTSDGVEVSEGLSFWLETYEHQSGRGKATLILHALDGWHLLDNWHARRLYRWNADSDQSSVKQILKFVLARVGLSLNVKSQSQVINEFYPDFTIHPGNSGKSLVFRLLSYVPDLLFIEGINAYLVFPQESDISVYSFGESHQIYSGRYFTGSFNSNQVHIQGYDESTSSPIIVVAIEWTQMEKFPERAHFLIDRNISTLTQAHDAGEIFLRKQAIDSRKGVFETPVNCGQQLLDVIAITDAYAGLLAEKHRIFGILLEYQPAKAMYSQQISLGGV